MELFDYWSNNRQGQSSSIIFERSQTSPQPKPSRGIKSTTFKMVYFWGDLLSSPLFYLQNLRCFFKGTEWTCTKKRMLAGIITDYAFGLGYILLAGIAYLIRDWRKLQLAISAPGFLLIFYIWWGKFNWHLNIRSTVYLHSFDSFFCFCPLFSSFPVCSLCVLSGCFLSLPDGCWPMTGRMKL